MPHYPLSKSTKINTYRIDRIRRVGDHEFNRINK